MKKLNISAKYPFLDLDYLNQFSILDWGYTTVSAPLSFNLFEEWVDSGGAGSLNYLQDHRKNLRKDIKEFFPDFKSSLVFAFSYDDIKREALPSQCEIAGYALGFEGQDYHFWIKEKLELIAERLQAIVPCEYKISLDTHPVLERDLAFRSGLGWFGKNSMIINPKYGSYFLIESLLLSEKLEIKEAKKIIDFCGRCTKCLEACPTKAITKDRTIIADQCISTFTIEEFKDVEPNWDTELLNNHAFGCDICQDVCPWNKSYLRKETLLQHRKKEEKMVKLIGFFNKPIEVTIQYLNEISNREYKRFFKGTSFERLGRVGLLKNLKIITKNFLQ